MSDDPRLDVLLARREAMRHRGETVHLEALCHDCPELLPDLRERLERESTPSAIPDTLNLPAFFSNGPPPVPDTIHHGSIENGSSAEGLAPDASLGTLPNVPGYELLGELGRGGMGVVYKARHLRLNRLVALKMVLAGAHAGTQQLVRFQIEAQSVASL